MQAYLDSARGKDRTKVNYQNSDQAPPDWKDLICILFNKGNDSEDEYTTPRLSKGCIHAHSNKAKDLVQDQKSKLRVMIRNYNLSGNGSDMAKFPKDTDGKDEVEENKDTYGRFNVE